VVLKAYDPRRGAALEREVRLLREAGPHPGLVRLEAVVQASGATHLVLEACGGGTLIEAIANNGGRLPERVAARRIVGPLLRALAHLHSRGIVHRCACGMYGGGRRMVVGRGPRGWGIAGPGENMLDWTGLDWDGMGWAGLGWAGRRSASL
jgi:hypothetical protein